MKYISYIGVLFLIFSSFKINAQKTNEQVVVYLKDGSQLIGTIDTWDYNEKLILKTGSDQELVLPSDQIEKVIYRELLFEKVTRPYTFKEQGYYYQLKGQFIMGNIDERAADRPGYGVSVLFGKRYNRYLGIGIGVAYENFIHDSGEHLLPVFAEVQGYFNQKNTTPFYSLALGYAIGFNDSNFGISDAKGGIHIYPALGIRFGYGDLKYTIDLGYKYQRNKFNTVWWDVIDRNRITYKRLALRFGLLF